MRKLFCAATVVVLTLSSASAFSEDAPASDAEGGESAAPSKPEPTPEETEDLARQVQNPVASLISVPLQSNFNFGVGPDDDLQYILNVQPVIPIELTEDWNLIARPIIPLVYQPTLAPGIGDVFGLGDMQLQAYFSPSRPSKFIWGAGPVLQFPTATDDAIGQGKWAAGPGAVGLTMSGPWVFGALVNNVWSFAGEDDRPDVNQMIVQPFANYNFEDGWYATTSPIITANWEADDSDNRWTVPVGAGLGRIFRIGSQPLNAQLASYYNVVHPDQAAEWQIRFQIQLLFPR